MSTDRRGGPNPVSYRAIFALAWPASIAAAITPALGAIDVWALAQSDRPLDIAAIGLGSVIFSLVYWSFGFIRMSVAGLTAQAHGAADESETRAALIRGAALGGAIGAILALLHWPIGALSFELLSIGSEASNATMAAGRTYFDIRIWGAPFALATYAGFGWLTARGHTDYLMYASLIMTGLNIVLDYWFVVGLGWGAAGVAAGTLIAEIAGFFVTAIFVAVIMNEKGGLGAGWSRADLWRADRIAHTLTINRDIFIRTLILAICFAWFTQRGGAFGDTTLAANQVLLQLFLATGLALDGTAIAAETLVGQSLGARDQSNGLQRYKTAVRRTFVVGGLASLAFVLIYLFGGQALVSMLTPDDEIRTRTLDYLPWVIISPLAVVFGFQLDGIFIGATRMREMRDSMIMSALIFLPLSLLLASQFGNHGLWAAFNLYFLIRGLTLWRYLPRIRTSFEVEHNRSASQTATT